MGALVVGIFLAVAALGVLMEYDELPVIWTGEPKEGEFEIDLEVVK